MSMSMMWKHFKFDSQNAHFSCDPTEQNLNEVEFDFTRSVCNRLVFQFDSLLQLGWDRAVDQGLFNCAIDRYPERRILDDGPLNYTLSVTRFELRRCQRPSDRVIKLVECQTLRNTSNTVSISPCQHAFRSNEIQFQ